MLQEQDFIVSTFSTIVRMPESNFRLKRQDVLLSMGSCFAEETGHFFCRHKFNMMVNPLGIVFNPVSLARSIQWILERKTFSPDDPMLVSHDGLWHSLLHHGRFSRLLREDLIRYIDISVRSAAGHLAKSDFLLITLGSAHAYRHLPSDQIVANCHKLPADLFRRELLSIDVITESLSQMLEDLRKHNPGIRVLLTVSPVRYLRDGLVESNRSKAHLLAAVHQLMELYHFCSYFPAYEMVIDELRDYRFFKEDMTHPTTQAVEYVMERFLDHYADEEVRQQIRSVGHLLRSLNHRPIHSGSIAFRDFLISLEKELVSLKGQYPGLDFSREEEEIRQARQALS